MLGSLVVTLLFAFISIVLLAGSFLFLAWSIRWIKSLSVTQLSNVIKIRGKDWDSDTSRYSGPTGERRPDIQSARNKKTGS